MKTKNLVGERFGNLALDWSYDHADPNELVDHKGRPYSTDIRHYDPRCRSCHRRLDSRNAKARRVSKNTTPTERAKENV